MLPNFADVSGAQVISGVLREQGRVVARVLPPVAKGIDNEPLDRHLREALIQHRTRLVTGPHRAVHITAVSLRRYRANEVNLVLGQVWIRNRWPGRRHRTDEPQCR